MIGSSLPFQNAFFLLPPPSPPLFLSSYDKPRGRLFPRKDRESTEFVILATLTITRAPFSKAGEAQKYYGPHVGNVLSFRRKFRIGFLLLPPPPVPRDYVLSTQLAPIVEKFLSLRILRYSYTSPRSKFKFLIYDFCICCSSF